MRSRLPGGLAAALLVPLGSSGCAAPVTTPVLRPAIPVIVLVQRFADPPDPLGAVVGAAAAGRAAQDRYQLQTRVPGSGSVTAQAGLVMAAIAAHARALIVDPVDYAALLPALRAAHDAAIPVVVTGVAPDTANTSFVVSFVAAPGAASTDGGALALVAAGRQATAVGPRACDLVRAAVAEAVAAANNDGDRVRGFVPVPVATATTAGLRAEGIAGWSHC